MSAPILRTDRLCVSYGRVEAVRAASIEMPAGGVVTVIGANGAGKTSLLNAIMGVLPMSGEVVFDGRPLKREPIEERVAGGLSLVPEKRELFASMSVEDNLRLGAYRLGGKAIRTGLADVFARFPRLEERREPDGRHAVGRRAPDARDGPGADGPAAPADARRAEPRPRAAHREGHLPHRRRTQGDRRLDPARRAERPRRARNRRLGLCDGARRDRHAGPGGRARGRQARDRKLPRPAGGAEPETIERNNQL